jgi:hypothetical protein
MESFPPEPPHQSLDVQDVLLGDAHLILRRRLTEGLKEPFLRQTGYLAGMKQNLFGLIDEFD